MYAPVLEEAIQLIPIFPNMRKSSNRRGQEKEEVDYEALHSPLMQIPNLSVFVARHLLDLGFSEPNELKGRSPEVLFEDLRDHRPNVSLDCLYAFRMAVYYSETPSPDPKKLKPWVWQD